MAGPTTKRRWFQFSLTGLLLMITVVVVSAYAVNEHHHRLRLQAEVAAQDAMIRQLQIQTSLLQNRAGTLASQFLVSQQRVQAQTEAELRRQLKSAVPVAPTPGADVK